MPVHSSRDLIVAAGSLLGERIAEGWEELESESTVLRAMLESGRSIIVKHVTDTGFDQPDHEGAPQRFLNEWAGLSFLSDLGADDVAPRLVAAETETGILVMEDLGERPNLETVLLEGSGDGARAGLVVLGSSLAELHGVARGKEEEFSAHQGRLGTGSPRSDSTIDQRDRRDLFAACFEDGGVPLTERAWASLVEVEESMHGVSPFRTLIHADSGPQNLLLMDVGGRLIDFEYCVYGNGLADVAGARLGFPQTVASMEVPVGDAAALETAYRDRISEMVPEASDESTFDRALGAASAHWALNRLAAAWRLHVEPRLTDSRELPESEAKRLAKTTLVLDGFVRFATGHDVFEELAEIVSRCCGRWMERWPQIDRIPVYPALRNDG